MSNNFSAYLTDEQKQNIIAQRIQQFAVEGYQISINRKVAEATGDEAVIAEIDKNIETLTSVIAAYQAELDALPKTEVTE
jgi:metal-dependent amidase/aminoacylase/carboxypeptidase family protein